MSKEYGDTLADYINDAIDLAKNYYNTNVVGIITDNDSKIKCGAALAHDEGLLQATCFSHSRNLLIKSMVDAEFAGKLRVLVSAFDDPKMNALVTDKFKGNKLKNFPDTCFFFLRNTCESILKNLNKEVLQQIVIATSETEDAVSELVGELVFDEDFRKN